MAWKPEYGRTRDRQKAYLSHKKWIENHPEGRAKISRRYAWKAQGIVNFGTDEYEAMHFKQNCKCAICETEIVLYGSNRNDGDACVDHDHDTGVVRGLLCRRCNLGLGFLGDNLESIQRAEKFLSEEYGGLTSGCM